MRARWRFQKVEAGERTKKQRESKGQRRNSGNEVGERERERATSASGREASRVDSRWAAIGEDLSRQVLAVDAARQRIQEDRLAGSRGAHDGQRLACQAHEENPRTEEDSVCSFSFLAL